MLFRQSNSPLYAYNEYQDLQIYNVVQKGIRNGQVLYRDIFDHKGPALFLIGTIIYYNKYTIWAIDIITCAIQVIFSYKQIRIKQDIWKSLTGQTLVLTTYTVLLIEQGQPEQMFTAMMFIQGYLLLKEDNSWKSWIIHQIFVQFIFYSKINITSFWIPMFLYLSYKQLKEKKLFINLLSATIVFQIVQFIILQYFIYYSSVKEFINSYFILNIKYSNYQDSIIQSIVSYIYFFIIAILIFIQLIRKTEAQNIVYLIQIASLVFGQFTLSRHIFPYYLITTLPIFIFIFNGKSKLSAYQQVLIQLVCIALTFYCSIDYARQSLAFLGQKDTDVRWQFYQDIKKELDNNTFYGVQTVYTIQANLAEYLPYNNVKYPVYCNMTYNCNPEMYEYTLNSIDNMQIEYIAILTDKDGNLLQSKFILGDNTDILNKITNKLTENYTLKYEYKYQNSDIFVKVFKANKKQ